MPNLSTTYLGLPLNNPIIVSASPLSENIETLQKLEAAGAAAVVLFSLFEEQVELSELGYQDYYRRHPEALPSELQQIATLPEFKFGASSYLAHLFQVKKALKIPVIASLNGYYGSGWTHYAKLLESAGADGLELNIYYLATKPHITSAEVERMYLDLVRHIKENISIPVSVKLSPYFSAMANIAHELDAAGADGLVLFNRFYQPDFDIESGTVTPSLDLSQSTELRLRLRWTAILYKQIEADLAVTGGVHTAVDIIKSIMAGAHAVMMTSALYQYGLDHITTLLTEVDTWLTEHDVAALDEIRGSMSVHAVGDSAAFERANYMRVLKTFHPE